MTKEQQELLNEARRRYPLGTKFISCYGRCDYNDSNNFDITHNGEVVISTIHKTQRVIYKNDKWATIISKSKLNNNYYFY